MCLIQHRKPVGKKKRKEKKAGHSRCLINIHLIDELAKQKPKGRLDGDEQEGRR